MTRELPPGMVKRGRGYHADFRCSGRRVCRALGSNRRVAEDLLLDLRARAKRGDFGMLDLDYPWADLKKMFLQWARQNVRRPKEYERHLQQFERFAKVRNVAEVTADRIDAFRHWRMDVGAVSARTVNMEVGTISNMLNKGVNRFHVIDRNPIANVAPLPHTTLRKQRRSLSADEVERIFETSPEYLRPVWRMFMTTGIRKSELVGLTFDDVDWERQTITIRASNSKNKRAREIPVDDATMALLVELRERAADRQPVDGINKKQTAQQHSAFTRDRVFVSQANTPLRNNLLRKFYGICRRAGVEGAERGGSVDIHSLRVTFATLTLENGANPKAVQAILGHATLAMTMGVYSRATERAKRDAVSVLPFASASAPGHVLPMQKTHERITKQKNGVRKSLVV